MKSLLLKITADSPLVITEKLTRGMNHQCLPYIPGNMLLGAFASIWKKEFFKDTGLADDNPVFAKLFLNGGVKWGCAYPQTRDGRMSVPLPVCYQKLKNHGGLPSEGVTEESCVYNTLKLDMDSKEDKPEYLYQHFYKLEYEQNKSTPKPKKLNFCFMTDEESPKRIDIHQHWDMHVALGQQRSALEGKLYGYNSIARGTSFISELLIDDDAVDELKKLLPLGKSGALHLGSSRSAGYGFASYQVLSLSDKVLSKPSSSTVLYLLSDYVPKKPWLSPLEGLKDDLACALNLNREDIDISDKHVYTGTRNLDGFNCLWNLPRMTQTAFIKGSVIAVSFKKEPQAEFPAVLGARLSEGCGRVAFDPLFLKNFAVSVSGPVKKEKVEETKADIPVVKSSPLLKLLCRRMVLRKAAENSQKFAYDDLIGCFIDSIRLSPTQNQLGNIRAMLSTIAEDKWVESFEIKLSKTPGEQWTTSNAKNPFSNRRDFMHEIMLSFLDPKQFEELLKDKFKDISALKLPPQVQLDPSEITKINRQYFAQLHRASLLEIIKRWNRKSYAGKGE